MSYHPDIHRRRSIRLPDYDYTCAGVYFVTICTFERECLFGDVVDGVMRLNEFGGIVRDEWLRTPAIRSNVKLDEFVVMPNHFHAIVMIENAGAHCMRPGLMSAIDKRAHIGAPLQRQPDSLGTIIAGFKSVATKHINTHRHAPRVPVWQRNYYEHVIRNDRDLAAIREYIAGNPGKWAEDEDYPGINA